MMLLPPPCDGHFVSIGITDLVVPISLINKVRREDLSGEENREATRIIAAGKEPLASPTTMWTDR